MITTFKGKKITGMLTVMPENEYDYDEETKDIATLQTRRLKKNHGIRETKSSEKDFYKFRFLYIWSELYV